MNNSSSKWFPKQDLISEFDLEFAITSNFKRIVCPTDYCIKANGSNCGKDLVSDFHHDCWDSNFGKCLLGVSRISFVIKLLSSIYITYLRVFFYCVQCYFNCILYKLCNNYLPLFLVPHIKMLSCSKFLCRLPYVVDP